MYNNVTPIDALRGVGHPTMFPFGALPVSPEAMIYYQKMVELEVSRALKEVQGVAPTDREQCTTQTGMVTQTPMEKVGRSSSGYYHI